MLQMNLEEARCCWYGKEYTPQQLKAMDFDSQLPLDELVKLARHYLDHGVGAVYVTLSEAGCAVYFKDEAGAVREYFVKAVPVERVVDTTGCVEAFAAGLAFGYLKTGEYLVMDPWYSLGTHDLLEVASMGLHVGQMTALDEMPRIFEAVTVNGARTLGLEGYGLEEGCHADFVILQAADPVEALRLKPARLFVVRRGRIIAQSPPSKSRLHLDGRELEIAFTASPRDVS